MLGHITWHELMTTDPKAAMPFYTKVVGWGTEAYPGAPDYTLWTVAGQPPMGGLMTIPEEARRTGAPPNWLTYVATPDADGTAQRAVALGGKVLKPVESIPEVGRFAVLADPQGAVFAILQPARPTSGDETAPVLGDFSWHELAANDWQQAWTFYSQLFGWEKTDSFDMGPAGLYQMFGRQGKTLGGFYNRPAEVPAPYWLPYALVKSADAAAATAVKHGAKIIVGPMEVPGGDRIAVFIDPQGAAFAVHSKATAAVRSTVRQKAKARKRPAVKAKKAMKRRKKARAKQLRTRRPKRRAALKAKRPRRRPARPARRRRR